MAERDMCSERTAGQRYPIFEAGWQWQRKVVKTMQRHCLVYEFIYGYAWIYLWICRTRDLY